MFINRFRRIAISLIIAILSLVVLVNSASARPILKNEVEDLEILISQFVGGIPNVLVLMDLSGSMGRNFGGKQVGNWDRNDVLEDCGVLNGSSSSRRARYAHCSENTSNLSVCGSVECGGGGTCGTVAQVENLTDCVLINNPSYTLSDVDALIPIICGGGTSTFSGCSRLERERLAAAIEADAGLTQCSIPANCKVGSDKDPSCNTSNDQSRFNSCMLKNNSPVFINKTENCSAPGNPDCVGRFEFGSTRFDVALSVFFDLLDADNSLDAALCSDPGMLFDGANSVISCREYMETPFRDVQNIARFSGSPNSSRKLPSLDPVSGASAPKNLISHITDLDAEVLGIRLRAMSYSGLGNWNGCTGSRTIQVDQGGFAGQSKLDLDRFWRFYRREVASGGTSLAWTIGLDDSNSPSSTISKDMLNTYRVELQTDPSISCRPEFAIVITDGEDTCSGQCNGPSGSGQCFGSVTTNANRRSSIQSVSNLRTYYSRNPISNSSAGGNVKKEILTFVIGIGLDTPESLRTLHAMALAGGTSIKGVIKHTDPDGNLIGKVDLTDPDLIPYPQGEFDVFRDFGSAKSIDTVPSDAHLKGCLSNQAKENGAQCTFQTVDIFDDTFFDTGVPFLPVNNDLTNFAFVANSPEELAGALLSIFEFIQTFSTSGSAPSAPQSSTSVALRDRIFLSLVTPITSERMWQGRLGLYGFVDDPDNPGSKIVVADIDGTLAERDIFAIDGSLNLNAKEHYWEAGKLLTERDIVDSPRNLYTVDTSDSSFVITERDTDAAETLLTRKAIGPLMAFNTTNIAPVDLGITDTDADLTNLGLLPRLEELCGEVCPDGVGDVCEVPTLATCKLCLKECLRDETVEFLIGNTEILPVGDPMQQMGTGCPDPDADIAEGEDPGSFATCSVRLGDIFHSTPKVVGSPSALFFDFGFQNFAINFRERTGVVYVGANDGFLHAFHAGEFIEFDPDNPVDNPFNPTEEVITSIFGVGTGDELFGFASPSFLPNSRGPISPPAVNVTEHTTPDYRFGDYKSWILPEFTPERSWFDGSPLVADIWIDGKTNGITDANTAVTCTSGTIGEPDGVIDECGKEWHTMLLTTPRNGGGIVSALNITNIDAADATLKKFEDGPAYPSHFWTLFDKNFGNVWGDPVIGRVKMQTKSGSDTILVDRWVMFLAGGVNPLVADATTLMDSGIENDLGNAFYVIDLVTGKIIFKYARDATAAPNATIVNPAMACDLPGTVGAFDVNNDGYIDIVYTGDRCGRLWRFDVSLPFFDADNNVAGTDLAGDPTLTTLDAGNDSVWTGSIAFCANTAVNCDPENTTAPYFPNVVTETSVNVAGNTIVTQTLQPIFFAPTVVLDDLGRRHVVFLTGNRREPSNIEEQGKVVSFIDTFIPALFNGGVASTPPTVLNFDNFPDTLRVVLSVDPDNPDQFLSTVGTGIAPDGEFLVEFPNNAGIDPPPGGEKGFGIPVVINRVLLWTTFAPSVDFDDPCSQASGFGRIFAIDYLTGEPALSRVPGAQSLIDGSDKTIVSGKQVAEGMPTPAQLSFGARGSVVLVVAFSGSASVGSSQFLVWELPPFPSRTQTLFWEELF